MGSEEMETQRRKERRGCDTRPLSATSAPLRFKNQTRHTAKAAALDAAIRKNLEVLGDGE